MSAGRRACRLIGLARSIQRRKLKAAADEELRSRLGQIARERQRFGYRRLTALLQRQGRKMNHKRIYRLYRTMGLAMRRKLHRHSARRLTPPAGEKALAGPDQCWAMDFVSDRLPDRRRRRLPASRWPSKWRQAFPGCAWCEYWKASLANVERRKKFGSTMDRNSYHGPWAHGVSNGAFCSASSTRESRCRTDTSNPLTGAFGTSA